MPTAVLVDGAYFIKRFRRIEPQNAYDAERAADLVHRWAIAHLSSPAPKNGVAVPDRQMTPPRKELYRIFSMTVLHSTSSITTLFPGVPLISPSPKKPCFEKNCTIDFAASEKWRCD